VEYLKRLVELAAAGFVAGAGAHVAENGLELSEASARGLVTAGLLAGYGVVVKKVGEDKDRPTVK
jgi:hypothetical protein